MALGLGVQFISPVQTLGKDLRDSRSYVGRRS